MKRSPVEGSCAEDLWHKHGVYNNLHCFLSSPYLNSPSALWEGGEEPGSAQRLHKNPIGPIKALDSTAMVQPTAGTIQGDWWTSEVLSRSDQQGFHHSTARSSLSEQKGSPSAPFLSQRHKSRTHTGNSLAAIRISNCNSHTQALLMDRWQEWCSLQPSCSLLSCTSTAHFWMTADVKSLRNEDPTTMLPAFKECHNQPAMSA